MRYILYFLLLLISSSCIGQVHDYNIRIDYPKDPDSVYVLLTGNSGAFAGRGRFNSLPQLATVLQPYLSGGGGTWGSITGTLSNQTDLQNALNAKLSSEVDGSITNEIQGIYNVLSQGEVFSNNGSFDVDVYNFSVLTNVTKRLFEVNSTGVVMGDIDNINGGNALSVGTGYITQLDNFTHDSKLGINKNGSTPAEALDVTGNGLFSGTLNASNLSGTNTGDQDLSGYLTSEVDGSTTNEIQTLDATGTTTVTWDLSDDATDISLTGAGISAISRSGNAVTVTSTEVDGSTTNEIQTITNTSDATSHTVTLSNSGGSTQFIEGSGVTLTTGGTGSAGTVTIASTATGVSDGDKGDITVSSSGTVWDVDAGVIGDNELGTGIDATQLADGTVTSAELQYINTLTSNAQTQLNGKFTLAGASGGQTAIGGTGTTDDLILQSTSGVGATGALIQAKVGNNGGTTAMTIVNTGQVGIGTTSPQNLSGSYFGGSLTCPLWVSTSGETGLVVQGTTSQAIQFVNNTSNTATADFGVYSTDLYFVNRAGGKTYFDYASSNAHAMVFSATGKVGILTTSADAQMEINLGTSDKFRLTYNDNNGSAANYMDATISSTGSPTFNATGTSPTFTFSDPVLFDGYARLKSYTVGTLPTGVTGAMAYVTDATAPTYLGALTGGGAVTCPVFYNGSAWVSH